MRRKDISFLIVVLISAFFIYLTSTKYKFRNNNANEFFELIKGDKVKVLDVRTNSEFIGGHIENAINIDVSNSDFLEKCKNVFSKNDIIAVYCHSGTRSKKAAKILTKNGFNVINLKDGITGWGKENLPIVRPNDVIEI